MKGALELHVGDEVSSLALVGRDDPDLVRLHARLDEPETREVSSLDTTEDV